MPDTHSPSSPLETEAHLGAIATQAIRYWRVLPLNVKSFYDLDDMIADLTVHVFSQAHKYNPALSRPSTWVTAVSRNRARYIVSYYCTQKRRAVEMLELDGLPLDDASASRRLRDSCDAVERVIELGSDALQDTLAALLRGDTLSARRLATPMVCDELRKLSARCSTWMSDFEAVCRYAA